MLIGKLVERSGLSKDTIRFYERKGLISLQSSSRRDNNYKEYPEDVLEMLTLIRRLKDLGFTLNEIKTFLGLWHEEDASCKSLKHTLETKLLFINEQLLKLVTLKDRLMHSVIKCNNDDCEFETMIPSRLRQ